MALIRSMATFGGALASMALTACAAPLIAPLLTQSVPSALLFTQSPQVAQAAAPPGQNTQPVQSADDDGIAAHLLRTLAIIPTPASR